jgi:hypothetical protein
VNLQLVAMVMLSEGAKKSSFLRQNGGTEARSAPRPDILCVEARHPAADPNRLHFGKWRIINNLIYSPKLEFWELSLQAI